MKQYFEVRWHGRGGQGTVTAAKFLAEAVQGTGKFVSAFPDYGPERRGAPLRAYNRFSNSSIRTHLSVRNPDAVVVVDPTLIGSGNLVAGIADQTAFIVNTEKEGRAIREATGLKEHVLYTVPANVISEELFGREIPNSAMMGAFSRAFPDIVCLDTLLKEASGAFTHLLSAELAEKNMDAIRRGHDEAMRS